MYNTPKPRTARKLVAAMMSSALLAATVPALASAECASTATTHAFAQFQDSADYSLLSGGGFESGAPGWSLNRAGVVNGNETFNVGGGSHSLAIQSGGEAVSPSFCVGIANPTFRFFLRQTGGGWGALKVVLRATGLNGIANDTAVGFLEAGSSWNASPVMKLANVLPLWQPGSTLSVKIVFKPEGAASWTIDDVYIDPYRR